MAAAQLILDTDIIIDYLRRRDDALRLALTRYHCGVTAITWYELMAAPTRSEHQVSALGQLLDVVEVLPFDRRAAEQSANVWRLLAVRGEPIGLPDTLLAGICLASGLPLLTHNTDHFSRVDGLRLLDSDDLSNL